MTREKEPHVHQHRPGSAAARLGARDRSRADRRPPRLAQATTEQISGGTVAADTAAIADLDWALICEFAEAVAGHEPRLATHLLISWCGCQAMLCAQCAVAFDPPDCYPDVHWRCAQCRSIADGCPHRVFTVRPL